MMPIVQDVVAAVRSLYTDELRPLGRVILKRIREHAAAAEATARGLDVEAVDPETMPRIDPKQLRKLCLACRQLCVEPEEGKEYSALLSNEIPMFVEVCSQEDPFPSEFWIVAAAYFQSLDDREVLPSGRYACAKALMLRRLPFLEGRSLGQVCHIVQLAISQKRLLGYHDGQFVPFHASDEWVKERCAFQQQHFASKKSSSYPVASWVQVRTCLRQMLSAEPGFMTLSNVKRLFHRNFGLELSETALGFTRLVDLLQDPRFHDVCSLGWQGQGQILVQRVDAPCVWSTQPVSHIIGRVEAGDRQPLPVPVAWHQPAEALYLSTSPQLTQLPLAATSVCPASTAEVQLEPKAWDCLSPGASPRGSTSSFSFALEEDNIFISATADESEEDACLGQQIISQWSKDNCIVKNTFLDLVLPESNALSGSARRRTLSEPKDVGFRHIAQETLRSHAHVAVDEIVVVSSPSDSQSSWADVSEEELSDELVVSDCGSDTTGPPELHAEEQQEAMTSSMGWQQQSKDESKGSSWGSNWNRGRGRGGSNRIKSGGSPQQWSTRWQPRTAHW